MRLTRKKALEICVELWTWLSQDEARYKEGWPGWRKYGHMTNRCPCCEYHAGHKYRDVCPIWGKCWNNKDQISCIADNAPFHRWCISRDAESVKAAAQEIAMLAKIQLEKIKKGEL
jgi:hypothetical protein